MEKTERHPCGCTNKINQNGNIRFLSSTTCNFHSRQKIKEEAIKEAKIKINATTEINCEECKTFICWCYDSDINCCYFFCNKCKPFEAGELLE